MQYTKNGRKVYQIPQRIEGRRKPWRVRYSESGKQKTVHFETEYDANQWIRQHAPIQPVQADDITESERMLIKWARLQADENGLDLQGLIARMFSDAKMPANVSCLKAVDAYEADMIRRGVRKSYLTNTVYILRRWIDGMESHPLHDIQPEQVRDWCLLGNAGSSNQDTVRSRIVTFLNWAKEQGWTRIETSKIRWRRAKADRKRIGFYSPGQVQKLLNACPDKLKFPTALLFLTGIRPKGEFTEIRYDNIDARNKVIHIPETASKTRTHRILHDLPENLWAWYKTAKPKQGRVLPITYRNYRANLIKVYTSLGYDWPQDCTRHTFATCAFHRGLEWALDTMGHTDSRIFMKHYKGQVPKDEAEKLWAVLP